MYVYQNAMVRLHRLVLWLTYCLSYAMCPYVHRTCQPDMIPLKLLQQQPKGSDLQP